MNNIPEKDLVTGGRSTLPRTKKAGLWLTLLLLLMVAAPALYWFVKSQLVTVYVARLPSGELFLMEDPEHPELRLFREEEGIDRIIAPHSEELPRLHALAEWTSNLFKCTSPFPEYPPWNASETLRRIRGGQTGGFCAQYAIIFGQSCQSLGYQVRYCDLASEQFDASHFVPEVYLPSLGRWVVFEPQFGFFYTDAEGNPLGILDLHNFLVGRRQGKVLQAPEGSPVSPDQLSLFYHYRFYLRNNFLTVPARYTVHLVEKGLQWVFEHYVPACDELVGGVGGEGSDHIDPVLDIDSAVKSVVFSVESFLDAACGSEPNRLRRIKAPARVITGVVEKVLDRDLDFHPLNDDTSWWPLPRTAVSPSGVKTSNR